MILLIPEAILRAAAHGVPFLGSLLSLALYGAYVVLLIGGTGKTVGMRAVGTLVIDANTGGPISYGRSLGRWATTVVLVFTIIGGLLDIFWPLWDDRNQTLHDKMVGTVVIHSR